MKTTTPRRETPKQAGLKYLGFSPETPHHITMNIDPATIQALLDNDQPRLTAILAAKQKTLLAALGERCPECGSTNWEEYDEQGYCDDCEAHWYLD